MENRVLSYKVLVNLEGVRVRLSCPVVYLCWLYILIINHRKVFFSGQKFCMFDWL